MWAWDGGDYPFSYFDSGCFGKEDARTRNAIYLSPLFTLFYFPSTIFRLR